MNNPNEEREDLHQHCFDPFPEPQTIPAGWDTSMLLSAPIIATVQQAEDSTENKSH